MGWGGEAYDGVALADLDGLEAAGVVHGARAAEVAGVAFVGVVVGVGFDPGGAAGGGAGDDAIEEGGGDAVAAEGGSDDETGDADDGGGRWSLGVDVAVEAVVGAE